MSGREAERAAAAFVASLQRCASCVTEAVLVRGRGDRVHRTVRFGGGPAILRGPIVQRLSVLVEFTLEGVSSTSAPAPSAYTYEFQRADGRMGFAYHWHPVGLSHVIAPHLHVGGRIGDFDLSKLHLPTGPVPLQAVLRFAIEDLGVEPSRADWRAILSA